MKKILSCIILLIMLLAVISINVFAEFNEEPEIKDEENDTIFGYIDILTVWFEEYPEEPDYLYTNMELRDIKKLTIGGLYQIQWNFNDYIFASFAEIGYKGRSIPKDYICGEYGKGSNDDLFNMLPCEGYLDYEDNIITWKIPKENIGNPNKGDILEKPWAKSCFSGIYGIISFIRYIPILGRDLAPTFTDQDGLNRFEYGRDYVIKY